MDAFFLKVLIVIFVLGNLTPLHSFSSLVVFYLQSVLVASHSFSRILLYFQKNMDQSLPVSAAICDVRSPVSDMPAARILTMLSHRRTFQMTIASDRVLPADMRF